MIRRLNYHQVGQAVRDDGPESHLSKSGTPTMGGALILVAIGVLKLKERLFGLPEGETNLTHEFSKPINSAFASVMSSERLLLRNMEFPFGHSLIAMASR